MIDHVIVTEDEILILVAAANGRFFHEHQAQFVADIDHIGSHRLLMQTDEIIIESLVVIHGDGPSVRARQKARQCGKGVAVASALENAVVVGPLQTVPTEIYPDTVQKIARIDAIAPLHQFPETKTSAL